MSEIRPWHIIVLIAGIVFSNIVSAISRSDGDDYIQFDSDAAYFFETASDTGVSLRGPEAILLIEHLVPLAVWRTAYKLSLKLGISANREIGILVNGIVVLISLISVLWFAKSTFSVDQPTLNLIAVSLSVAGMHWLFAGLHLRDAFVQNFFILSTIAASQFTYRRKWTASLAATVALIVLSALLFFTRTEGAFFPPVALCVALSVRQRSVIKIGLLLATGALAVLAIGGSRLLDLVLTNYEAYRELTLIEDGGGIGATLLYDLPIPISTVFATLQILFVKIPIWRGMFVDAYSFFVSVSAMQMLVWAPPFLLYTISRSISGLETRESRLFILRIIWINLVLTAATSIQVRHFAALWPFVIILSSITIVNIVRQAKSIMLAVWLCISATVLSVSFAFFAR